MSTIVTRVGKGSPLTWTEVDSNFTNLNTDKLQSGNTAAALTITSATINGGAINGTTIGASTPAAGTFTSLSDSGNLTFTGTGNRITGDFSSSAVNRVSFQSSTTNGNTTINVLPNGTATTTQVIAYNATDPTNSSGIGLAQVGTTESRIQAIAAGTGTFLPMTFYTNGSERMRIDTSGNVGIGTSSFYNTTTDVMMVRRNQNAISQIVIDNQNSGSSAQARLALEAAGGGWYISNPSSAGSVNPLTFTNAGGERMRIDSSGNVGIGTSSPAAQLSFSNSISGTAGLSNKIQLYNNSGVVASSIFGFGIASGQMTYNCGDGAHVFYTNGATPSERMRIDSSGNVGIGTSNPQATLNVAGQIRIDNNTTDPNNGSAYLFQQSGIGWNMASTNIAFTTGTSGARSERMRIDSSGNVGIGTTVTNTRVYISSSGGWSASNWGRQLFITTPTNSSNPCIGISDASGGNNWAIGNAGGALSFSQMPAITDSAGSQVERARIDSNGLFVGYTTGGSGTSGVVRAVGYNCKTGFTGALTANGFNINWTGTAQLWIDSTNVGTITLTSDYRIKKNIETNATPALERIEQLRPVIYEFADYKELFKEDGVQREGFIAHELQAVIPSAVEGEKDAENQVQSLKLDALCSVMVKAIQELKAELDVVKSELNTLKGN